LVPQSEVLLQVTAEQEPEEQAWLEVQVSFNLGSVLFVQLELAVPALLQVNVVKFW